MVGNYQIPYVACSNVECDHTIPLPGSSHLGKSRRLPGLREDAAPEIYVCPQCAHVYVYTEQDCHEQTSPTTDPYQLGLLTCGAAVFLCAEENCRTQVRIQKPFRVGLSNAELRADGKTWIFADVRCRGNHRILALPDDFRIVQC